MIEAENAPALIRTDLDARLPSSGMKLREVILQSRLWWDREGRHVVRNPVWHDPDLGFASGITRGLLFEHLTREEQAAVISQYHRDKLLPLVVAPDPIVAAVEEAARRYRERVKAGQSVLLATPAEDPHA